MRDQLRRTITRKFEIGTHASCSRPCILRIVTIVIRQRRCLCLFFFPPVSPEFSIPRVYSSLRVVVFFFKTKSFIPGCPRRQDRLAVRLLLSSSTKFLSAFPLNLRFEPKTYRKQVLINSPPPLLSLSSFHPCCCCCCCCHASFIESSCIDRQMTSSARRRCQFCWTARSRKWCLSIIRTWR